MKTHNIIQKLGMAVLTTLMPLCFTLSAMAQGNLVVNGGFDTDASGWTITNVSGGGGYASSVGNPPGSIYLYNPLSQYYPTASQTINSLTPGGLYIVSGDYQMATGQDIADNSFGVALDGVFLFETRAPTDFNWHSFNFDYTVTSTSALLFLSAQINKTDDSYFIDNIAMYAVPEPSSMALLFLGCGALLGVRRNGKGK